MARPRQSGCCKPGWHGRARCPRRCCGWRRLRRARLPPWLGSLPVPSARRLLQRLAAEFSMPGLASLIDGVAAAAGSAPLAVAAVANETVLAAPRQPPPQLQRLRQVLALVPPSLPERLRPLWAVAHVLASAPMLTQQPEFALALHTALRERSVGESSEVGVQRPADQLLVPDAPMALPHPSPAVAAEAKPPAATNARAHRHSVHSSPIHPQPACRSVLSRAADPGAGLVRRLQPAASPKD